MATEIEMEFCTEFQANSDYFTSDNRCFARIYRVNGNMVAGQCYLLDPITNEFFPTPHGFLMPMQDLSDFFAEYNEELDNWEEEFENEHL